MIDIEKLKDETTIPIYIAKNDGPQSFSDTKDQEFANILETWYNSLDEDNLPNPREDGLWREMQNFWFWRHQYYVFEIMKDSEAFSSFSPQMPIQVPIHQQKLIREQMPVQVSDSISTNPMQSLSDNVFTQEPFAADYSHVKKLYGKLTDISKGKEMPVHKNSSVLDEFIDYICFEDTDSWGEAKYYPKLRMTPDDNAPENRMELLRKLIKHFKLLKTVLAVWLAFLNFHSEHPKFKISFKFLPKPRIGISVSAQELGRFLNDWSCRVKLPALRNALEVTRNGIYNRTFHTKFHCELQLLWLYGKVSFDSEKGKTKVSEGFTWNIFPYIGCSKLSCYMCWKILQELGFSTRNTHGKIRAGCAFPLQLEPGDSGEKVKEVLQHISVIMSDKFEQLEENKEENAVENYRTNISQSETVPKNTWVNKLRYQLIPDAFQQTTGALGLGPAGLVNQVDGFSKVKGIVGEDELHYPDIFGLLSDELEQ
ncbi:hypothetical protein B0O99DRAFT_681907 [Bisporella sp. PMI_857]|nr:hypothetical protein B0O99DRAFT_681907 [Bisporella sp. PMI_857]